jgi:coenzyme F420-reducing hydrogenase gamma subunit
MYKPKVGVFGLAGCGGCQLEVLNLEDDLVDFIKAVDIVHFTEAISEHSDTYEVALIEGSVSRSMIWKGLSILLRSQKSLFQWVPVPVPAVLTA